jgi:hypothetical protein
MKLAHSLQTVGHRQPDGPAAGFNTQGDYHDCTFRLVSAHRRRFRLADVHRRSGDGFGSARAGRLTGTNIQPRRHIMARQFAVSIASFALTAVLIFVSGTQGSGFIA